MIAICDKSNSNQWMFLAMLSTGLKKKIKMNNISFYIQLYKQGRLKYHSSIMRRIATVWPLLSFAVFCYSKIILKRKKNRQWWALQDEHYSMYINWYRTKNKMKQINCSNAGDQWHHSKRSPLDFTEKLFRLIQTVWKVNLFHVWVWKYIMILIIFLL